MKINNTHYTMIIMALLVVVFINLIVNISVQTKNTKHIETLQEQVASLKKELDAAVNPELPGIYIGE
jgi:uncharacterized membrane protein (DUF106 family)